MKRKKFFSKLTLLIMPVILGLTSVGQVNAAGVLNGVHYWTVEDLLQYDREMAAEREAECGMDAACWGDFYVYHMDHSEDRMKYQNLENFNIEPVVISSINPSTGEIRFVYHGQTSWNKNHNPDSNPSFIDELYMVWLDADVPDPGEDFSWYSVEAQHFYPYYVDEMKSGSIEPYTHPVFWHDRSITGQEYPWEEEISFWSESDLEANSRNAIYYTSIIGGVIRQGMIDYSSCLNHPYYRDGMECRFIYDLPNVPRFVPFAENGEMATAETVVDEDPIEETPADNYPHEEDDITQSEEGSPDSGDDAPQEVTESSEEETNIDEANPTDSSDSEGADSAESSDLLEAENSLESNTNAGKLGIGKGAAGAALLPRAPETGVGSSECVKKIEFPWWFLGLILVGDAFIMWLFFPTNKRK